MYLLPAAVGRLEDALTAYLLLGVDGGRSRSISFLAARTITRVASLPGGHSRSIRCLCVDGGRSRSTCCLADH